VEKKEDKKKKIQQKKIKIRKIKKEDEKVQSIPKFNGLFPEVENEVYIIETKVKLLKEMNLPEYIKKKLEFIDIPG